MNIIINPEYRYLTPFIKSVPEHEYQLQEVFCNKRNTVERVLASGKSLVIKRYKRPTLINCVVYTWFRKSKARRSFEYAGYLLKRGIETAIPIAYIETKKNLFFHTGYFISEYLSYPLLSNTEGLSAEEKIQLAVDFIEFTAHLHQNGILHQDYNQNNILYYKENGKYHFALIDINRIYFGRLRTKDCLKSFGKLGLPWETLLAVVTKYSKVRSWNVKNCLLVLLLIEKSTQLQQNMKQWFKELFYDADYVKE